MIDKFKELERKLTQVEQQMADPEIVSDRSKYTELNKNRLELEEPVSKYREYKELLSEIKELRDEVEKNEDPDLVEYANEELPPLEVKEAQFAKDLHLLLLPKDPNDNKNAYIEIRSGTGGEEAALFAKNLNDMYLRYCQKNAWNVDLVDLSEADAGGFAKVILYVKGDGVYGRLKYESGTHRVQRVPSTEASGRIHTSAATVAILPEVDDVEVDIDNKDLKIDTYRSSGAGGQHVNKTDSAIRITHLPSGIVVTCQEDRSQHKNKDKAMKLLKSKLWEVEIENRNQAESQKRKLQVGSGDRSEKIRTYNYPQGRVTDHRISLTLYKLDAIMLGDIDEIVQALIAADQMEKLNQL
jgi:peptide chain release factor 1